MSKRQSKGFEFKPFSVKQRKLMYWWKKGSPYCEYDMMIADGSIRSGKTIACICSFLVWSQTSYAGQNFIIAGKTISSLKKNVIGPLQGILSAWGWTYQYNRSENYIKIGTNMYFMYDANNQASQDKLQGLTAAGAYADEVGLFPQNFIDQMIGRCSVDGSKIFMNCNPESPRHYIKTEFIDKAKEKQIYHLHFRLDDNLSLSEKIKAKYERMFTGVFYRRFILGEWCIAEGLVYPMFDRDKNTVPEFLGTGRYWISIDYGIINPFSAGLWCLRDGVATRIAEYYYDSRKEGSQRTDEEHYTEVEKLAGDRYIQRLVVDPSASSFIETVFRHGRFAVDKACNDVIPGIAVVSSLLSAGKIQICQSCKDCIREFETYSWDSDKPQDAVIKEFDHSMDEVRYFAYTILRDELRWNNWG